MRANLLIIDDDEHLGAILRRLLRGYDVVLVTTAEEGLAYVADRAFDGILCDLSLPGKSGADFYAKVAQMRPGQEKKMRFITGGATEESCELFIARHPGLVLHKPFDMAQLRELVADLVSVPQRASAF